MNAQVKLALFIIIGLMVFAAFAEETMVIIPVDDSKYLKCSMTVKQELKYGYVSFNTCTRCAVIEGQHFCTIMAPETES